MAQNHTDQFVDLLTRHQTAIYAYILSLLPSSTAAEDLVQDTNMTLWRKHKEFTHNPAQGTPEQAFMAWASKVAYFKILAHRRKMARDRHVFDDEVIDYLAERMEERQEEMNRRRNAMQQCMTKLQPTHRDMLQKRYADGGSVSAIAAAMNRSAASISQTLYRVRIALLQCIQKTLSSEGGSR